MSRRSKTIDTSYFDKLYIADPDPWKFSTSAYEREKYATTIEELPRETYVNALEAGCSIGILTRLLAQRCRKLLAFDASGVPLQHARDRCKDLDQVSFMKLALPDPWPAESYDLMVFSEVLYYLEEKDLRTCARHVASTLAPGGDVVLVHYTDATDYPLSGDAATQLFADDLSNFAKLQLRLDRPSYRLEVWRRES